MSAPIRRSRRERKVNPKYIDSAWDTRALQSLIDSSSSSTHASTPASNEDANYTGHDVVDEAINGLEGGLSNGDEDDGSSVSVQSSTISTPAESSGDEDSQRGESSASDSAHARKRAKTAPSRRRIQSSNVHSRGVKHIHRKGARDVAYTKIFGPELADLNPTLQARNRWLNARDITLPSRSTLASPTPVSEWSGEFDSNQTLVFQNQLSELHRRQQLGRVIGEKSQSPVLDVEQQMHPVAIGPWEKQVFHQLKPLEPLDFSTAWKKGGQKPVNLQVSPDTNISGSDSEPSYHQGWLINFGAKVQCVSWAQCHSSTQYLAVACKATAQQRSSVRVKILNNPPSFHPSAAYPSSIQIWAFGSAQLGHTALRTLSQSLSPRLALCLKIQYGDVRQLQWSPGDVENAHGSGTRDEASPSFKNLAVLFTDGCVRILSIAEADLEDSDRPHIFEVGAPAVEFPATSGTIFTTLTWLSSRDLALGASDGVVRLYNILSAFQSSTAPPPYWTYQLHSTYIMSICPAFPSTIPHIIASTSASGDLLLTDLRSPDQDRVHLPRARLPSKLLIYAPLTRSFITVFDHSGATDVKVRTQSAVLCHNLRHFYSGVQVARLPELSGGATALAGSTHHPCLLIGNARGTVFATNYLRKILPISYRSKDVKHGGAFLQKVCEYEWRATPPESHSNQQSGTDGVDLYHGRDVPTGISRFHEGFRPEKIDLVRGGPKRGKRKAGESDLAAEVMFEEEQAVTAIDWNPNAHCAGWAALGWGSGIVRVQDLSYEDA